MAESDQDYSKLKVAELKDLLKERKLTVSGSKAELIARLKGADAGGESDDDDGETTTTSKKRKSAPASDGQKAKKQKTESSPTDTTTDFTQPPLQPDEWKIVTWNVASLNAVLDKGLIDYIKNESPDILCLNETKAAESVYADKFTEYGYPHAYFSSCTYNVGYAGTALLSKTAPLAVTKGIGIADHDTEGRVITAEYEKFYVVATYIPNAGQAGPDKWPKDLAYRAKWDEDFLEYLLKLKKSKSVIWCGDLNVAHKEVDLAKPKTNTKTAGFTEQERKAFQKLLDQGFVDTYRSFYPDEKDCYTYWSYRFNCRAKNLGWRLDYFIVTQDILSKVTAVYMRRHVQGSDHCPLVIHLKKE